jgi:hypothetical protein
MCECHFFKKNISVGYLTTLSLSGLYIIDVRMISEYGIAGGMK